MFLNDVDYKNVWISLNLGLKIFQTNLFSFSFNTYLIVIKIRDNKDVIFDKKRIVITVLGRKTRNLKTQDVEV